MTFGAGGDSDKENDTLERNDNNTVDIDAIEKASESTTKASGTTANEAKRKGKSTEEENGEEQNPHKEADEAKDRSKEVLSELKKILQANPDFCTVDRKNALLNSLLEEASVLPTSGSRGCTAAIVELTFHSNLMKQPTHPDDKVPVYRGEVEFITLADWQRELKYCTKRQSTSFLRKLMCSRTQQPLGRRLSRYMVMPHGYVCWQAYCPGD